ncbi:MAG: hypothetical protein WCC92_18070 [Candidatus Korobacteraceae bacterium]
MAQILAALRNPIISNGLCVLSLLLIDLTVIRSDLSATTRTWVTVVCIALIAGDTAWLNIFAWKNPRFLAYGPDEYLRESELEHERKMAGKQ